MAMEVGLFAAADQYIGDREAMGYLWRTECDPIHAFSTDDRAQNNWDGLMLEAIPHFYQR